MAKPKTSFRFTAAAIDRIKPPEAGRIGLFQHRAPGDAATRIGCAARQGAKKVYRVKTRITGKQVPMTLGSAAVMSLAEASKRAREFLAQASAGVNLVERCRRKEVEEKAAESVQTCLHATSPSTPASTCGRTTTKRRSGRSGST